MPSETKSTITTPADPMPAEPVSLPGTLVGQLRAMRALIPEYTQLSVKEKRALIPVAKATDPDFVQAAINSVGASQNVEQALGQTPTEMRLDTADALSWTVVEDEARALLNGIATANLVRRYRIGRSALAVYSIARRLAQQPEHADLLPHVETMRCLNRFGVRKRAKTAGSTPAPAPSTPAPTTTTTAEHLVTAPESPKPEQ